MNYTSAGDMGSGDLEAGPQIENLITGLQRGLASEKSQPAKVLKVRQTLEQISEVRRANGVMEIDQEIYFDFLTDPLAEFFDQKFHASKCLEFDQILRRDFEPSAEDIPTNPPVKKAYELIASVCS